MHILDALSRFEVQIRADGRSEHRVKQYQRHLQRFASWLAAEHLPDDVRQLEPDHLARSQESHRCLYS